MCRGLLRKPYLQQTSQPFKILNIVKYMPYRSSLMSYGNRPSQGIGTEIHTVQGYGASPETSSRLQIRLMFTGSN